MAQHLVWGCTLEAGAAAQPDIRRGDAGQQQKDRQDHEQIDEMAAQPATWRVRFRLAHRIAPMAGPGTGGMRASVASPSGGCRTVAV